MQHLEGLTTYPERLSCEFLSLSLSPSPMMTPRCTAAVFDIKILNAHVVFIISIMCGSMSGVEWFLGI